MRMSAITRSMRTVSISILAVLLASCGGGGGGKYQYNGFVVIGASLSDTGNVSAATSGASPGAAPNYFGGRWSNGTLWIENVASSYGKTVMPSLLGGKNYAYGGAKTCAITGVTSSVPDMCVQTTQYLTAVSNVADAGTLYVIDASSVGNEINTVIGSGGALASTLITTTAPANVITLMQRLYTAGARRFLVVNVPDVGKSPLYLTGQLAGAGPTGTALANGFNAALASSLTTFATTNSGASVARLDAFALISTIIASPAAYGFNNTTAACTLGAAPAAICATPDTYVFSLVSS
jgi:phospholipase/lecithinase/hemolysin